MRSKNSSPPEAVRRSTRMDSYATLLANPLATPVCHAAANGPTPPRLPSRRLRTCAFMRRPTRGGKKSYSCSSTTRQM
eukprot:3155209-Prymnesium_polylepis.1